MEQRTLLAGNVLAVVSHGSLIVVGDNEGAAITLSQPSPGRFTLTGEDTTINGLAGPVTVAGVTRDVRIQFGNGDDSLVFDQSNPILVRGNLSICGGRGSNMISTPFDAPEFLKVGGDLSIFNLPGRTQLITLLNLNVAGDLQIRNSGGTALVSLDIVPTEALPPVSNIVGGNLMIANGPGAVSQIALSALHVGHDVRVLNAGDYALTRISGLASESSSRLNIVGGDVQVVSPCAQYAQTLISKTNVMHDLRIMGSQRGSNAIFVNASQISGSAKMQCGQGDDTIVVGAAIRGAFHLDTGNGSDAVYLEGATFGGVCHVQTGEGDDTLSIGAAAARQFTFIVSRLVPTLEDGVTVYVLEFRTASLSVSGGAATFYDKVMMELGHGDDTLNLATSATVEFRKVAWINGGAENNRVSMQAANLPRFPVLKHF